MTRTTHKHADVSVDTELARELVGHVLADDEGVRVDRQTQFGNPFRLEKDGGDYTRRESVERYEEWLTERVQADADFRADVEALAGEKLDCWCQRRGRVGPACHAEVLATHAQYLAEQ